MSTLQIYTSTSDAILSEVTKFKNNSSTKLEFNSKIFLNVMYLLNNVLSKPESSKENEELDFYFPYCQLSYSMETQLSFEDSLQERTQQRKNISNLNEVQFEEVPIIMNFPIDESFSIFDKDDDLIFQSKKDLPSFKSSLDNSSEEDWKILETAIESSIYSDENSRRKNSKNEKVCSYLYSPKIGKKKKMSLNEMEMVISEFNDFLPKKTILWYLEEMNENYLRYMLFRYLDIKKKADQTIVVQEKMFMMLVKEFLLKCEISNRKIYGDSLRNLVYQKDNYNFEFFLTCFQKVLKLKESNDIIKYKFLLYLTRMNEEEEINIQHIRKFLELINCKIIYEEDIFNQINENIIERYSVLFPGGNKFTFKLNEIMITLESFFENR